VSTLAARADALLAAHRADAPLLLPNVWDVASAKVVEAAGFPVVATSSRAIAEVLGVADDDSSDPDLVFEHLGRLAASVDRPVTADLEAGYRLAPDELVERMLAAGIVGCNLEDTDHHGDEVLVDAARQAEYLAAVRAAAGAHGVHVVINARIDCFIRHLGDPPAQLAEALRRAERYLAAGADCVYPIALADRAAIASFVSSVPGPVNVTARPGGLSLGELAELGVRRVSLGSGLFNLAREHLRAVLARLGSDGLASLWPPTTTPR